jgi:NAD(P)-dependent dehydrogenase (short-subunit alcohol dehydrogenase family)
MAPSSVAASFPALDGRRLLIMGASSGIGLDLGLAAVAAGARVAFAGRRTELLDKAVQNAGSGALAVRCDVTVEADITACVEQTVAEFGGLDAFVYSTAIDPLVRMADVDAAAWHQLMATNVIGASLLTAAALPHLQEVHGRAVYISATSVGRPLPGMGAYATSKAALEELARAWRSEYRDVQFGVVAVGMTLGTGVFAGWDPALMGELSPQWAAEGYLLDNGPGTMDCPQVSEAILAVLATPTFMPYVSVLPDPARSTPTG